jgi:enamine deaminase RidA (YjgF/YER057c/UK114 family)
MSKRIILRPAGLPAAKQQTYGICYGHWVFVSAIMATDFRSGLLPRVRGNSAIPLAGEEITIRETNYIYETIQSVLATAGTDIQNGVRIDQFPVSRSAVDPYHVARKSVLKPPRPASTSVDILGLLAPEASIQVEMIAIIPAPGFEKKASIPIEFRNPSPVTRRRSEPATSFSWQGRYRPTGNRGLRRKRASIRISGKAAGSSARPATFSRIWR